MKLNITQRDIDLANKYKKGVNSIMISRVCPIACALKRVTHHVASVGVSSASLIANEHTYRNYHIDEVGSTFVRNYDTNRAIGPVTIELTPF